MLADRIAALARELVRAVRGSNSQRAVSRWLGYRTNAVYRWEAGTDSPSAARFFVMAKRCRTDCDAALGRFWRGVPPPLDLTRPEDVAALLRALRGRTPIAKLAADAGATRSQMSRWLSGQTEPSLPQFLATLEVSSLRLLDFVTEFAKPEALPSIAREHADLQALRRAAHDVPWTQAVLRCLELVDYENLPRHAPGWIAQRLGITPEDEQRCLELLHGSGQVVYTGTHYRASRVLSLDTRRDAASTLALRSFWLDVAREQLQRGHPGVFSYNVVGVSNADLQRLRQLHADYYQQVRSIVAQSEPVERVAVLCAQIFALDAAAQ